MHEGDIVHLIDRWGHPYTGTVRTELALFNDGGTNLYVGPYLVRTWDGRPGASVREIVSVESVNTCCCCRAHRATRENR